MSFENGSYRLKDAHKRLRQKEDVTHPVTGEEMELGEHDRTLAEILRDKNEQDTFLNSFCREQDEDMTKDIVESLASNTILTPEQNKFLEKMRKEYNVRTAEVEKVQELVTEQIARIGENDPRIQQVIGQIGSEKASELLGREFASLAMGDTKRFKKVVEQMRQLREINTHELTAGLERHVRDSLVRYGISEEQYWEATKSGMTAETQENLSNLVSEQYGWFKKAVDFASGKKLSRNTGVKLYRNFEDQMAVIQASDKHMKAIGRVLQGTLNANVNLAIQKAMMEGGDVKEKKVENNVKTIDDYRAAKADLETFQDRWQQYKASETKRMNIKDLSAQTAAFEGMKNRFTEQELQKRKAYRPSSIFATMFALLFGPQMLDKNDIKNSLK